jgi:undecaprenyl-diphosphatase
MTLLVAILLGVVQGLTEFLPISSTAHLTLVENLLLQRSMPLAFDVLLHTGTLLALCIYFRRELGRILLGLVGKDPEGRKLAIWLVIAMIPTVAFALLTKPFKEAAKVHLWVYGACLLLTALLLWTANELARRRAGREVSGMGIWDALAVGSIQGIGGGFGLSRSGSTISMGVFRGLSLPAATRFSFLLGIPTIFGAAVLEGSHILGPLMSGQALPPELAFPPGSISPALACAAGVMAAALSGYAAIGLLDRLLQKPRLKGFAAYCILVGLGMLYLGR